ncbi:MAG TPA: hypothetical protein PLE25_01100 [Spirochaetales bacterium]|nr:hypothetical protein [Spirochaetales bacterium]
MKRTILVVALLAAASASSFAEDSVLDLFFPDHTSSIAYFDAGVVYAPIGTVASGGIGLNFNAGFNIGRLFHEKLVLSPFAGVTPCFLNAIKPGFIRDLADNYETPERLAYLQEHQDIEEERAYLDATSLLDYLMAGEALEKFSITMRYGVLVQLPWRFFPPIALYGLYSGTAIVGSETRTGYDTVNTTGAAGLSAFGYGIELYIFRGPVWLSDDDITGSFHASSLSLIVEVTDLKNAIVKAADDYYGTPDIYLYEFTSDAFEASHPYDWRISINYNIHVF